MRPNSKYYYDGYDLDLPVYLPRPSTLPPLYTDLLDQSPPPQKKLAAGDKLVTDPVTQKWYHIKGRTRYWYKCQEVDIRTTSKGMEFVVVKRLKLVHFLKFRHFLKGAWVW